MKDTKSSAMRNSHNVTVPNPKKDMFEEMTLEGISGMVVIEQNEDNDEMGEMDPYEAKLSATLQPNMNDHTDDLLVYDEDFDHINGDLLKGDSAVRSNEDGSSSPNSEPNKELIGFKKANFVTQSVDT